MILAYVFKIEESTVYAVLCLMLMLETKHKRKKRSKPFTP